MTTLKQLTDEQLVALYSSGDNESFDVLLARHKDRLFSFIFHQVLDEDTANDIFQDTFVRAIIKMKERRYKEVGKFYPWLTRIAQNTIIDFFRSAKVRQSITHEEAELSPAHALALACKPNEDTIFDRQCLNDVKALVDELPQSQRDIVNMRYYQNLSFKEIAALTGVSINTALGRMRYAILNMRKIINERGLILTVS